MVTCRDIAGCPASFYLDVKCASRKNKNCWETPEGCQVVKCRRDCRNCRRFGFSGKEYRPLNKGLLIVKR